MSAKNKVIEGDYIGSSVIAALGTVSLTHKDAPPIMKGFVTDYEVMDSERKVSGVSAVGRAAVGSFFLGPVGLLAGATAKKKGTHLIAVEFKDGKRSLLEVDDKVHKAIIKALF